MRNLIAICAAVLTISAAHANEYSLPNKSGGEIRLTDVKCTKKGRETWFVMYAFAPGGSAMYGCWFTANGMVHVGWEDGTHSIYKATDFMPVQSNQPSKGVQL